MDNRERKLVIYHRVGLRVRISVCRPNLDGFANRARPILALQHQQQTLIVIFGCGLHQRWCGPVEEIRPGDVVTIGPDEKHWHGASPTTAMTHIAIQQALEGKAIERLEKVTNEQYRGTA